MYFFTIGTKFLVRKVLKSANVLRKIVFWKHKPYIKANKDQNSILNGKRTRFSFERIRFLFRRSVLFYAERFCDFLKDKAIRFVSILLRAVIERRG